MRPSPCFAAALILAAAVLIPCRASAQGGFGGPARYEITNVKSGKVIALDRNDRTSVIQFSPRNTDNQQWDVIPAEPGYWFFRYAMNGAALTAMGEANRTPVRGTPFNGSPSQQWRLDPGKDGNALITSRMGRTIDIAGGATRDGARVQTYEVNGDSNQRFSFRRIADLHRFDRDPDRDIDRGRDDWDCDRRSMEGDGVCFYREEGYRGRGFCIRAGEEVARVPEALMDHFESVKFFGRVRRAVLFAESDFGGPRVRIESDQPDMGRLKTERGDPMRHIVSIRVY